MKKYLKITALLCLGLSLVGCGRGAGVKTEKIKDEAALNEMNVLVSDHIESYFGYSVDPNKEVKYEAFNTFIPSEDNSKEDIPHNIIFQAAYKEDPTPGKLHGYGGILTPDKKEITGLIINVYNERQEPKTFTDGQLVSLATDFLKTHNLVDEHVNLDFAGYNTEATTDVLKVIILESDSSRFAVGIDALLSQVVYFEIIPRVEDTPATES